MVEISSSNFIVESKCTLFLYIFLVTYTLLVFYSYFYTILFALLPAENTNAKQCVIE